MVGGLNPANEFTLNWVLWHTCLLKHESLLWLLGFGVQQCYIHKLVMLVPHFMLVDAVELFCMRGREHTRD